MATNTGIPYEKLTQQIFDQILNRDRVDRINVEHNIDLQGMTTNHQIDVYWEFENGGEKYSTIIQAKDWRANRVNKGELLKFNSVLNDLPGQPKGIFVTRTGYQSGAREFAKCHGISLYELGEPTDAYWDEAIKIIDGTLSMFVKHHEPDVKLIPDSEWINKETKKMRIPEKDPTIEIKIENTGDVKFYDENDQEIGTVQSIIDSFYPPKPTETVPTKKTHTFDKPAFIWTGVPKFPRLKINAVAATVSVLKVAEETLHFDFGDFIIRKNVTNGDQEIFDRDANLIK